MGWHLHLFVHWLSIAYLGKKINEILIKLQNVLFFANISWKWWPCCQCFSVRHTLNSRLFHWYSLLHFEVFIMEMYLVFDKGLIKFSLRLCKHNIWTVVVYPIISAIHLEVSIVHSYVLWIFLAVYLYVWWTHTLTSYNHLHHQYFVIVSRPFDPSESFFFTANFLYLRWQIISMVTLPIRKISSIKYFNQEYVVWY